MLRNVLKDKLATGKKRKAIRKQMKMDRQCTKEFEALLGLMGKDLGNIEIIDATDWEVEEEDEEE